ncbi:MAG: PEP-CTERM sorting domain-containing protein, partial [Gemmataceae bacterium]|nr:PEP-CTERM sorting domain-containing protein [Gemmataceae bacterium]
MVRTCSRFLALAAVLAVALAAPTGTDAGIIVGVTKTDGKGLGSATVKSIDTKKQDNDNTKAASDNVIDLVTDFAAVDVIDIVFNVTDTKDKGKKATEYFLKDLVKNSTAKDWTDYHFELGFGVGKDFQQSKADNLDFDVPDKDPAPTSDRFKNANHRADLLDWMTGKVLKGKDESFTLSIDVPDSALIPGGFKTKDGYTFTLRQLPTTQAAGTPEPSSLALAAAGLAAVACRR